ncbi:MAG: TonB-dependent siderophore receptor, partial [Cyanobacteria bacterium P01_A01_bin.116]
SEAIQLTVTAATRTEASPLDVPQSIQVIPRELIEDRAANSIVEALRTSPGVVSSFDNSLFNDAIIRGFLADFRRNGLTNDVVGNTSGLPNNIERLEILRGPASVLYGQGSFGGTVNVITKQPTDEPFYSVSATAGNFERFGAGLDLSGPVNEEGTVKYRLNLATETEGGFIEDASRQRYLVAPVLAWSPNEDTDINFEVEYTSLTTENNFGIPALGTVLPNINGELDRGRYIGDGDVEIRERDTLTIGYDLEHRFNDNWRIHNAAQYTYLASPEFSIFEDTLQADERTLERGFADTETFDIRNYLFETYAVGNFNTGSVEHELLAGIELIQVDNDSDIAVGAVNPIDLFAPETDTVVLGPATDFFISESTDRSLGIYLQDRINFTDNLTLLLGGRFDLITSDFTDLVADSSDSFQEEEFSPRVGLVYQPIPELALYTNYSRSFIPNTFGFSNDGGAFPPQRGTQFEVGAKADINDRLSLTLAYFDLSVTNVPTTDPEDVFFQVVTGEQRSQGVELFAAGEILPGWSVTGGYTYNDARVSSDNDIPVGNRIPNNPEHAASLYTTYELQQGDLEGLGFGLGLFYVGEREGDFANSFEVPSYVRTDASIFYEQDRFRTALNFENLFNADYFENSESDLRVRPGAPFTVKATVSWDF